MTKSFVSLGLFIIDEFLFLDEDGNTTQRSLEPQVNLRLRGWLCANSQMGI
jgi:hypothetical protein